MTLAQEIAETAHKLKNAYQTLNTLKWTPTRTPSVRVMKPNFRSMSPEPDNGWAFNLENELMRETKADHIPGGLRVMAKDILGNYTNTPPHTEQGGGYLDNPPPPTYLTHIENNAHTITNNCPIAQDLLDLMQAQHEYLTTQLTKRYGKSQNQPEARHTAKIICALLAQQNVNITRQHLHTWSKRGHITQQTNNKGHNTYKLSEVIAWISRASLNN